MAHCEKLSYGACKEIEQRMSKISDLKQIKYGLVFLYAKEAADARIRAYLDKFFVKNTTTAPIEKLKEYVATKILICSTDTVVVDPERYVPRPISTSWIRKSCSFEERTHISYHFIVSSILHAAQFIWCKRHQIII